MMHIPTEMLELFLDSLHQGILVLDERGNVVAFNSTLKCLLPNVENNCTFNDIYPVLSAALEDYVIAALDGTSSQIERYKWQVGDRTSQLMLRFNPVDSVLSDRRLAMVVIEDITEYVSLAAQFEDNYLELERQLSAARRYQDALLTESYEGHAISCRAYAKPCFELSGDFFHASRHDRNSLFIIGDVQSHGIDVALRSITLQHLAKMWLHDYISPARVMYDLNSFAISDQENGQWMCCLLIAVFNRATGALTYCRAGIPEPLLLHANGALASFADGGTPLGAFENEEYEEYSFLVQPGDRLLMFSDGVTETRSATKRTELYGHENLIADYRSMVEGNLEDHFHLQVIERLVEYSGSQDFEDDLTLAEIIIR